MPTKEYMREYRKKRKQFAIECLGGKCSECGKTEELQFDHIVPEGKTNQISSMYTTRKIDFINELNKCQLLCYKCHLNKSAKKGDYIWKRVEWKHGVSGYINHCCRCEQCKNEYHLYRINRWKQNRI